MKEALTIYIKAVYYMSAYTETIRKRDVEVAIGASDEPSRQVAKNRKSKTVNTVMPLIFRLKQWMIEKAKEVDTNLWQRGEWWSGESQHSANPTVPDAALILIEWVEQYFGKAEKGQTVLDWDFEQQRGTDPIIWKGKDVYEDLGPQFRATVKIKAASLELRGNWMKTKKTAKAYTAKTAFEVLWNMYQVPDTVRKERQLERLFNEYEMLIKYRKSEQRTEIRTLMQALALPTSSRHITVIMRAISGNIFYQNSD